jgi:hypothetical protein
VTVWAGLCTNTCGQRERNRVYAPYTLYLVNRWVKPPARVVIRVIYFARLPAHHIDDEAVAPSWTRSDKDLRSRRSIDASVIRLVVW